MGGVSVSVAFSLAVMLKMHLIRNAIFQENEPFALKFLLWSKLYVFDISIETLALFQQDLIFSSLGSPIRNCPYVYIKHIIMFIA